MIRRATIDDAKIVNEIYNAPEVIKTQFIDTSLVYDMSAALMQPEQYIFLLNDTNDAMSLWDKKDEGWYEGHSMFRSTCRGKQAVGVGKAMIKFMHDMGNVKLYGNTPLSNKQARMFSRMIGFKSVGLVQNEKCGVCELFAIQPT